MYRMRTMLFCPASNPKVYLNAPAFHADCVIFDLEDAVACDEKDAARDLLCHSVNVLDFEDTMIFARVNSIRTIFCEDDLKAIVPAGIKYIRLSMCESKDDVITVDQMLSEIEKNSGIAPGTVKIQCSLETPKAVLNARDTVRASDRVISLSFGAEDYTRTMGTSRTKIADELFFARSYLPLIAAEAGITAVDTVWSFMDDSEGFIKETRAAKAYGFSGKSCIHPSQVPLVHQVFTPTSEEVTYAHSVMTAVDGAKADGLGVFKLEGKMIDEPVIEKAKKILIQAGEEM